MRHQGITVPDPEYKRFASAIRTARRHASSGTTHPVAYARAKAVITRSEREVFVRIAAPGREELEHFPSLLQIPIIPIYYSSAIQPDWPSRVHLPLQLRHRPGARRSGRRVRFRAGDGRFRFVRESGRGSTRSGARMRFLPGVRTRTGRTGGNATEHGHTARPRTGSGWTRHRAGQAVRTLVRACCSSKRWCRCVSGRLTQTSRSVVTDS